MLTTVPPGKKWVKIDNKTWVETTDPDKVIPIVKTNHSEDDYKKKDGVHVIHNGQHFSSKKDLAAHLGISQQKLSHHIKQKKIIVKVVKGR